MGSIFNFPWLVAYWKQEQNLGKLSVIYQVLATWGQLLQGLLFGFLDCLLRDCGLISHKADLLHGPNRLVLGLVAADCKGAISAYGLAIAYLYLQSLITL